MDQKVEEGDLRLVERRLEKGQVREEGVSQGHEEGMEAGDVC